MVSLEEFPPVDAMSEALEAGRRGLASIDRESIAESARTAARSVLPDDWFRPKRQRWPFVAISLVIVAALAVMFLLRRPITLASSTGRSSDARQTGPDTLADEGPHEPDASDVVTGPVGSASLRDPAMNSPEGADQSKAARR